MTEEETLKLLAIAATAYPNFSLNNERVDLWYQFMRKMPFERAMLNIKRHIECNSYPPTIADILKKDPSQYVDYDKLKKETEERLRLMDEWERKAAPYPGLAEGVKNE